MTAQLILKDDRPEYAVVPISEYEDLINKAEALEDIRDFDRFQRDLDAGNEELVPATIAEQLIQGKPPSRYGAHTAG